MVQADERQLDELLARIADHIDLGHLGRVDGRYRDAFAFRDLDRPPLVVLTAFASQWTLPSPWDGYARYPYGDAFENPVAMMQNALLDRVVPGLILHDDSPLSIRSDHGTIQIASRLGGRWRRLGNDYPWVEPVGDLERLRQIARGLTQTDHVAAVGDRSVDTLKFFAHKLRTHPPCDTAIQVSLPDLQGPIDTAEQLRGSDLFLDICDDPDLVSELLARIVGAMLEAADHYRLFATDRLEPVANTQHGYVIPGRLMIRNDSAILLSPQMYIDHVREHDARLLREIGGGTIHFCGDGRHLVEPMLQIDDVLGFDLGQPHMMDSREIYRMCRPRQVVLTHLQPARDDLIAGRAQEYYPTGVVMVYNTTDIADGQQVVEAYGRSG